MNNPPKLSPEAIIAVRRYRDILNKKELTNADIKLLKEVNEDLFTKNNSSK